MDYGNLFTRAWNLLWKNAYLILLGVLVVFGRGNSSGASQSQYLFQGGEMPWRDMQPYDFGRHFWNGDFPEFAIGGLFLLVIIAFLLISLVFWVLGLIARGGLISAVDDLERGKPAGFVSAFQAGWSKAWNLLGIGLVPAIPGLILLVIMISVMVFSGLRNYPGMEMGWQGVRTFAPVLFLVCLFVPIMLVFSALQTFANRSCMLEDTGVIASYRRGLEVLGDNLGSAVILYIIQVVISLTLGVVFLIPSIVAAVCCLLWPLWILIQACFVAFYSILWTLAWREWVGGIQVE
jgi:hypothetical protein